MSLKVALHDLGFDVSKIINVNVFRGSVVFVVTTESASDANALRALVAQGMTLLYQGKTVNGVSLSSGSSVENSASSGNGSQDDSSIVVLAITASVIIVR